MGDHPFSDIDIALKKVNTLYKDTTVRLGYSVYRNHI